MIHWTSKSHLCLAYIEDKTTKLVHFMKIAHVNEVNQVEKLSQFLKFSQMLDRAWSMCRSRKSQKLINTWVIITLKFLGIPKRAINFDHKNQQAAVLLHFCFLTSQSCHNTVLSLQRFHQWFEVLHDSSHTILNHGIHD